MAAAGEGHGWLLEAVEAYEAPLTRYARRLLDDVDLAADAVQHAFVKLCAESQERLEGRVAPWLFRVCRNHAVDHLRRAGRERAFLEADAVADPPDAPATTAARLAGRESDPAVVAERADLARHVSALLAALPAPQRETIDLWCEGLSHKQIADITGRTEGHVRVLAHRGLAALRGHPRVRALLAAHGGRDAAPTTTDHTTDAGTGRGTP